YYPASLLNTVFNLADHGILRLHESIKLVSITRLSTDRGQVVVGLGADLVPVEDGDLPRVRDTIRSGVPIYWDSHMARLAEVGNLSCDDRPQLIYALSHLKSWVITALLNYVEGPLLILKRSSHWWLVAMMCHYP